jgi:peptide/nickel transport system substrate-binding protein
MSLGSRSFRRPAVFIGALVLAAVAASGALSLRLTGTDSVVIPEPSSYTEGVAGTWQRINPIFASANEVDQDLSALIFAGLVRIGPDGLPQPDLADLPDITEDGTSYTFHLRAGLKWHDGTALTSRDFLFTVQRLKEPDFKGESALSEAWTAAEVETPDDRTVVIRLKQPSAPFLARYATIGIIPEHLLGTLSASALFDAPFNANPVGAGPYKLAQLDSRQATLTANADHHDGRPSIQTVRLRFYSDYSAALRAVEVGEVQGVMVRETLSDGQVADLQGAKGLSVVQPARTAYFLLYLNNDQALFQDPRVRRAVSLALDRKTIVDRVFRGAATPSVSAVSPETWAYAADYDNPIRNADAARKLLEEAGWRAHPTTGILVREGTEFRFTIRTDNDAGRIGIAGEVAKQLEAIGIRATVASTTFSVLRRDFLEQRKYDAAIAGWDQGADPDPYFGWHSSQTGNAGLNIANFTDTVTDELIARGRTRTDLDIRRDAYRQFQEKWAELEPSVIIAYQRYIYIRTSSVSGAVPPVLVAPSQRFLDLAHWETG